MVKDTFVQHVQKEKVFVLDIKDTIFGLEGLSPKN